MKRGRILEMNNYNPIRVLLDTAVLRHSATMVSVKKEHTLQLGSIERKYNILGMQRNTDHISRGIWLKNQVEALPTIMRLAREGNILIFSYIELDFETMRGSFDLRGGRGDLLKDVKIEDIPPAVDRSKFQQTEDFYENERLIEFCKFLIKVDIKEFEKRRYWFLSRFTEFERQNLKSLNRFKELCSAIDEKHYADAFHLWTAEVNGLDFFLTADRKFINVMSKTSCSQLKTKPVAPAELLDYLGIKEREPMPIADYDFHYLG
jgi:predicted nucleic acid-binding protein